MWSWQLKASRSSDVLSASRWNISFYILSAACSTIHTRNAVKIEKPPWSPNVVSWQQILQLKEKVFDCFSLLYLKKKKQHIWAQQLFLDTVGTAHVWIMKLMTAGFDFSCSLSCRAAEAAYNTCALHTVMAVVGKLFCFLFFKWAERQIVWTSESQQGHVWSSVGPPLFWMWSLIIQTVNPINEMIILHWLHDDHTCLSLCTEKQMSGPFWGFWLLLMKEISKKQIHWVNASVVCLSRGSHVRSDLFFFFFGGSLFLVFTQKTAFQGFLSLF